MDASELHTTLLQKAERTCDTPSDSICVHKQACWILALWHAYSARDLDARDMATLFLNGLKPITDPLAECEELFDTDEDFDQSADFIDFMENIL